MLCSLKSFLRRFRPLVLSFCFFPDVVLSEDFAKYLRTLEIITERPPRPAVGSVASGFGAANGVAFGAVSYSDKDLQTNVDGDDDGSIILGIGLGDPSDSVGLEFAIGITSVSTGLWGDGKFADEGNFNVKFHKTVAPKFWGKSASLAIGSSNLTGWGGTLEIPRNNYVVYSEQMLLGDYLQYGVAYTVGYGSAVDNGESEQGLFGGLSLARSDYSSSLSFINDEIHFSATWYMPNVNGLSINYTRADLLNDSGLERNIITLGYSFDLGEYR